MSTKVLDYINSCISLSNKSNKETSICVCIKQTINSKKL